MALSFDKVNKVITVLAPDTEITIQNLLDSIREYEDELTSMDIPKIVSCAGKEPLGGGVVVGLTLTLLDDWQLAFEARSGPSYIQCIVSGGNIVAVHVNGSIYPTAFTQVLITASSSATQADLAAIQYASYQNAVWVDVNSTETGTAYPVYTRESPGNNIQDAVIVANERGFSTIQLLSDITLQTGDILSKFKIIGVSHILTNLTIETGAICDNIQISKCWVTGVLDGGTEIEDCIVSDLIYFNGHIHNSGLVGLVTLDGNKKAVFSDCKTIDQDNPLVIDMGGSGQSVSIPNYSGLLTIQNLSDATQEIGIGLNAGMVILTNTITAGTIIIGGNGILNYTQTGTEIVNSDGLVNKLGISEAVWHALLIDYIAPGTFGSELSTKADLAASASTSVVYCDSGTIIYGNVFSGDHTDTHLRDGNIWHIDEDGTDGLTIEFVFTVPSDDHKAGNFEVFGHYTGTPSSTHYMQLWAYNYESAGFEQLVDDFMPGGNTSDATFSHEYYERHIDRDNANEVKIRLVHNPTTYNSGHDIELDKVDLGVIEIITAADIAAEVWNSALVDFVTSGTFGKELVTKADIAGGITVTAETDPIVKLAALLSL